METKINKRAIRRTLKKILKTFRVIERKLPEKENVFTHLLIEFDSEQCLNDPEDREFFEKQAETLTTFQTILELTKNLYTKGELK